METTIFDDGTIKKFQEFRDFFAGNSDARNGAGDCPICGSNMRDRQVTVYAELIKKMYDVYRWLGKEQKHEFDMKEIKHLLGKNEYANFGDLVRFGGIMYRPKGEDGRRKIGRYGMNMQRARE